MTVNAPVAHPITGEPLAPNRALQALLAAEGAILAAPSKLELRHIALEQAAQVSGAAMMLWIGRRGGRARILATSATGRADRNTPFAQWLEREVSPWLDVGEATATELQGADTHTPLRHAFFAPFPDRNGGLLALNTNPLTAAATAQTERLAKLSGTAHAARRRKPTNQGRRLWPFALAGLGALLCVPVPMTTLAPVEIVPSDPFHVTAPFDGVVEAIRVSPYQPIRAGAELALMEPTRFRNEAAIADKEQRLALARARRADLASFGDPAAKAEIAIARAEAELAAARRDYALDNLARTRITAPRTGVAILADSDDWKGRPVATGETLFEIADPEAVELEILAPLDTGEPLTPGTQVRLFLDSDPTTPIEAAITRSAFRATEQPGGTMAFETRAEFTGGTTPAVRLGGRGVAKIYGEPAPLAWWLLRKPVNAARQMFGI